MQHGPHVSGRLLAALPNGERDEVLWGLLAVVEEML